MVSLREANELHGEHHAAQGSQPPAVHDSREGRTDCSLLGVTLITSSFPRYFEDRDDYAGSFVYNLARHLRRYMPVHVVAPHDMGAKTRENVQGVEIYRFRYAWPARAQALAYRDRMPRNFRKSPFHMLLILPYMAAGFICTFKVCRSNTRSIPVAFWTLPQGLIAFCVSRLLKRPYFVRLFPVEISLIESKYRFLRRLFYFVIKHAEAVFANSQFTKDLCLKSFPSLDPSKISVIHDGIDASTFKRRSREVLDIRSKCSSGSRIILTVANLIERKGTRYLIEAMVYVVRHVPEARLVVVGRGPLRNKLESQVKTLGLDNYVTFTGAISNEKLREYYERCEVFVLPSIVDSAGETEGLGVVLLEAGAVGKPVIGTAVGGIPEIILDGETGLLVPEKDPQALADAILRVLKDRQLATYLALRGRERALREFSYETLARKFRDELLARLAIEGGEV